MIFFLSSDSGEIAEDDDYSASACAIIQRRNSSRRHSRRKRRPSSPFNPEAADSGIRRRSSVFTTSSGELVSALIKTFSLSLLYLSQQFCPVDNQQIFRMHRGKKPHSGLINTSAGALPCRDKQLFSNNFDLLFFHRNFQIFCNSLEVVCF